MIELESRTLSRPIPPQTNAIPSDYSSTPRSGGNRNRRRDEVSRPDGPNIEAQRVESGGAVLGEGLTGPPQVPHQLWGLRERCISSLDGVRGGVRAAEGFSCIMSRQIAFPSISVRVAYSLHIRY